MTSGRHLRERWLKRNWPEALVLMGPDAAGNPVRSAELPFGHAQLGC